MSPEPLGLVCNEPHDQETMGSGDENGIRASVCEYHQRTEHSYATPFPGLTRGIEPGAWERRCTHICDNYDSFGIQTQATLVEGEGSHRCAILMPTFLLSVAYLRAVSLGDQRNRASVKSSPATRMDKLRTESLHGRRLKEKEELRWALAKTREGKCGTHIFFFPFG